VLTPDVGHPALQHHLSGVTFTARGFDDGDWDGFYHFMDRTAEADSLGNRLVVTTASPTVTPGGAIDGALCVRYDVTEAWRASELNRDLVGILIASQEDERHRIARELHDDVSQKIALLAIGIDQLAATLPAEQSRFRELSDRAGEIATDIHDLSHELHPSKLQTLGLVDSLQLLCRDVARQGTVDVVFKREMVPQHVEPNVALCLYRIAQEALHNVVRHSSARHAEVRLAGDAEYLVLQVSDSGVGFDAKCGRWEGLGLASMRERAAFLKGQLAVHTFPGGGTRLGVRVPVAAPARPSSAAVSKTA
jgi:signal transduction histidine kinase